MKKTLRKNLIAILTAVMILSLVPQVSFADSGERDITVNFTTVDGSSYEIDFPYSDSYFKDNCNVYNHDLAKASIGLTVASFRVGTKTDAANYLEKAGFTDIDINPYSTLPTIDSIANCIGSKKIGNYTLIAVGVCGGDYGKEWASNFTVGDEIRSVGFNEAAQTVCRRIEDYIEEHGIDGELRLWVTGQSRAGAVSNIVAADMTDSGIFSKVYAYTFGTPRTTRDKGNYSNIFNIMSKDDVVPKVPLPDWGYEHYGVDLYLPSQECDSDYAYKAGKAYKAIESVSFRNNPELYGDYRVIFDYIYELYPTSKEYEDYLQEILISVIRDAKSLDRAEIAKEVRNNIKTQSKEQDAALEGLVGYIDMMLAKYLLHGNEAQVANGNWLTNQKLGSNLMIDHTVTTYASWILSADKGSDIYSENDNFVKLTLNTKSDVYVYSVHGLVETIHPNGSATYECSGYDKYDQYIAYTRNGDQVVLDLPMDMPYTVAVKPQKNEKDVILAIKHTLDTVQPEVLLSTVENVKGGNVLIIFSNNGDGEIIVENDDVVTRSETIPLTLPMSVITQIENINVFNLSISTLVKICIIVAAVIITELLLHLILAIIRKIRKRSRSQLSIDVTFIGNISFLLFAELAVWYFAPSVDILNLVAEILTYIAILVYVSRSGKTVPVLLFALVMIVVTALDFTYLHRISLTGVIIVCVRDMLLVTAAFLVKRKTRRKKAEAHS